MKRYFVFFVFIWLVNWLPSWSKESGQAQKDYTQIYNEASLAYETGNFDVVDSLLIPNAKFMKNEMLVGSYRLLALSSINQDRPQQAEEYVGRLLAADPYYTAYNDSPRFADIVERLKKGTTTISTASKVAESLEETPVPTTLITESMIEASGAQTVADVIALYVPGISKIASIEENMAMRGVSGLSQETILVMLDGHRMNSYSTNSAALDVRISLDKIQQIEVLRGPASSLYGNVALTAVINIITKHGNNLAGGKLSTRIGSNKTYDGSVMYGNGNLKTEFMAWASVYTSQGEKSTVLGAAGLEQYPNTTHYIDGFNSKPTYDLGLNMRWGDFKISAIGQYCKSVPYYNLVEIYGNSSYDKYMAINGEKPGVSRSHTRIDAEYNHTWDQLSLSLSAYAASEKIAIYNILDDYVDSIVAVPLAMSLGITNIVNDGVFQNISWQDYSFGGTASVAYNYKISSNSYGSLLAGLQYEAFVMSSGDLKLGGSFNKINTNISSIFKEGTERTLSAFMQLKHNFSKRFIFNGGLRYDHKMRLSSQRINAVSPRISLIWLTNDVLSVKAGFAHSFVDAPFFYRGSTIELLSSGQTLEPEKMNSLQIGANFNWKKQHLKYEVNCFYNSVTDLVYYSNGFSNAGKINSGGVENIVQYENKGTFANLNFTYQHPFLINNYYAIDDHALLNIPKFILNLTAQQRLFDSRRIGALSIRANMHWQSEMDCLSNNIFLKMFDPEGVYTTHQDAYVLVGAGIHWKSHFGLAASIDMNNLFGKDYGIGGQLMDVVPGKSFNMMGKISFEF